MSNQTPKFKFVAETLISDNGGSIVFHHAQPNWTFKEITAIKEETFYLQHGHISVLSPFMMLQTTYLSFNPRINWYIIQEKNLKNLHVSKYICHLPRTVADPGGAPEAWAPLAPKLSIHFALFGTILYKIRRKSFPFQSWAPPADWAPLDQILDPLLQNASVNHMIILVGDGGQSSFNVHANFNCTIVPETLVSDTGGQSFLALVHHPDFRLFISTGFLIGHHRDLSHERPIINRTNCSNS